MAGSNRKRKSSTGGASASKTKKARSKTAQGKQPAAPASSEQGTNAGGNDSGTTAGSGPESGGGGNGRRRNPHGIAPDDVEQNAKPTQRAFQRHIRMACGLLTADAVLGPADDYIDHYDKRFDDVEDMEAHMRAIISEVKKPNKDAVKRAERLIRDVKVLAKGEDSGKPGVYGQIAKDIAMIPAEHIAFVFGAVTRAGLKTFHPDVFGPTHSTYNQLHRHLAVSTFNLLVSWYGYTTLGASTTVAGDYHLLSEMYDNYVFGTIRTNSRKEFNTPGSLGKALDKSNAEKRRLRLCKRRYKEVKSLRYRKPILRLVKVEASHSDDERPPGGDSRKKRGLLVHTKEGRNPIVTSFFAEQDRKILKRLERSPTKKRKPERRSLANPATFSTLSRILPVGVPIDFWAPKFYNEQFDLHEKAMYVNTGVAFPLPQFCTTEHHDSWARLGAKDFMAKYGNDVLAQYQIPTKEELAGLRSEGTTDGSDSDDEEETDLEDTDGDDEDDMEA
ncbi:hypothetical protein C8R43DRAFT_1236452 [Mycena crocata]|nr:hypothetical protein C8R43DRAFT_1244532 [Mycena crocata]KAJ7149421.1 hypothetical protein C8R43DRAFT_1236452 [Mycena crocata]